MKKLLTILLLASICLFSILSHQPPSPAHAEGDPLTVNSSQFWADFPTAGTHILQLYVTNTSPIEKQATISLWEHYVNPDSTSQWIPDTSWVSLITPETQLLPPGTALLCNISITIPPSAPDGQYITWLKLNDSTDWNKPITITIRIGSSVPTYSYSLSNGSYYRILVTGNSAIASTDSSPTSTFSPIAIRSKCSATLSFLAILENPSNTVTLGSENSSIPFSPDERGITFQSLPLSSAQSYITLPATPITVSPFALGFIPWSISIPSTLPNGYWETWIRIKPAEDIPQMVGIEYCSRILIKVARTDPPKTTAISLLSDLFHHLTTFPYYFIPIAMLASILAIYLLHRRPHADYTAKLLKGNGTSKK